MIVKNKAHRYKKTALKQQKIIEKEDDGFCVGCYIYGGQLHNGERAEAVNCISYPINCTEGFYSKALNTFFVNNGEIYRLNLLEGNEYLVVSRSTFGEVYFIEYFTDEGAKVACCTGSYAYIFDGSNVKTVEFFKAFKSGVYNFGRFFFCDDYTVYWSGLGGIEDWQKGINKSGSVSLENISLGKILRLVVVGDKLVAVRECGFTVMRAFGTPENFKVDNVSAKCSRLVAKSVAVAQNKVFYFCENGMFYFDGSTVSRVKCAEAYGVKSVINACASNCAYYVYCYIKKLNKYGILCVQLDILRAYFIDFNAANLSFGDRLYAHGNTGTYRFTILQEEAFDYTSKPLNFNVAGNKVLRYICLPDDAEGVITVKSELGEREFNAKKCVKVNMAGDSFVLNFKGKCNPLEAVAVAEV